MHSKFPPTVNITSDFKGHRVWWMAQNLIFGHHALLKLVLSILHLLIYHKNLARECQMASKWITRGPKILLIAPQPPKLCNSNSVKVVTLCSLVSGHKEPKCSGSNLFMI